MICDCERRKNKQQQSLSLSACPLIMPPMIRRTSLLCLAPAPDMLRDPQVPSMVAQPDSIRRLLHPLALMPTWVQPQGLMTLGRAAARRPCLRPARGTAHAPHCAVGKRSQCPTPPRGTMQSRDLRARWRTCDFGQFARSANSTTPHAWPVLTSTHYARRWKV